MKNKSGFAQLFLRIALGVGFILPVMDRLGLLGPAGTAGVAWGDMSHFIDYTHTLLPFVNRPVANILGVFATIAEAVFGMCLIFGFKTRLVAVGAAMLTFTFGICMASFLGIMAPFNYPVFVFTGAAWLLSKSGPYKWSIDELLTKNRTYKKTRH